MRGLPREKNLPGKCLAKLESMPQLAAYTIGFAAVGIIAFMPLIIYGKSFINEIDGISQVYNTFVYTGRTVRRIFTTALEGGGLQIPWYDFSQGYGSPISYSFDPLVYVSVVVPRQFSELAFCIVTLVRFWLTGAAFLPLARKLGITRNWGIVSALAYAFSAAGLNVFLQISFLNQMIMLPLVVYGAISLIDDGKPFVYIASSAVTCLIVGLYSLYIIQLLLAVYIAVRFVVDRKRPTVWLKTVGIFVGCLLVALIISAPRSMTNLLSLSSIDRVSVSYSHPLLYSVKYYCNMFAGFLGMWFGGRDWFFGYGAPALLACTALFVIKAKGDRETTNLRVLVIVGTLFLCIPMIGAAFNGMAYVANRWAFGYALLIACVIGIVGSRWLSAIGKREVIVCTAALTVYALTLALLPGISERAALVQLVLAAALLLVVTMPAFGKPINKKQAWRKAKVAVAVLSMIALGTNFFLFLSPLGTNWQSRLIDQGIAYSAVSAKTPASIAIKVTDDEPYRFDSSSGQYANVLTPGLNATRILNAYGGDFYSPMYNNAVDRFHTSLGLVYNQIPNVYCTLDQRAYVMQLLGVKSYVAADGDTTPLPYGANPSAAASGVAFDGESYYAYEIEGATPLAIVFDQVMSESQYLELDPLSKQEALVQAIALQDADDNQDIQLTNEPVSFSVSAADNGIEIDDGCLTVKKPNSSIKLSCEKVADVETYLYVSGLGFEAISPRNRYDDNEWEALSSEERRKVDDAEFTWEEPSTFRISVKVGSSVQSAGFGTPNYHLYGGNDTWVWNLGYSAEGIAEVKITFAQAGVYTFDEFSVCAQPMETLDDAKEALARTPVSNIETATNSISCDVNAEAGQYLFLSVPYDAGWSATLNGEDIDVLCADSAFIGIRLPQEQCHIELRYSTGKPFLCLIGIVAALAVFVIWVATKRVRRLQIEDHSFKNGAPKHERI